MSTKLYFLSLMFGILFLFNSYSSILAQEQPTPERLISHKNPEQIALSPDGTKAIVHTRKADVKKNRHNQSIRLLYTDSPERNKQLSLPKDTKSVEWLPDGQHIAYLAQADQRPQVWIKEIGRDSSRQITKERAGVQQFSIAPDGKTIAYTTVDMKAMAKARKQAQSQKIQGVEVDLLTFSAHKINNLQRNSSPPSMQAFISDLDGGGKTLISDTLSVKNFKWSPTAKKIALTTIKSPMQSTGLPTRSSDLAIYQINNDQLEIITEAKQNPTSFFKDVISFSTPFWSPSGDKLGFVRYDFSDRWSTTGEIGLYDLKSKSTKMITSANKQEFYKPKFHWIEDNYIHIEQTTEAQHGLFKLSIDDANLSTINVSDDHKSNFSFSSDGQSLIWVQQSINQQPEIFYADRNFDNMKQISDLNGDQNFQLPEIKSIVWQSDDGTEVQGWYIYPVNLNNKQSPPVITLLHGGPGLPVTNKFHPYLQQWPFPIQSLTAKGYAIFIPNYRHTKSFGKDFMIPSKIDKEPIEDVISGIKYLVSNNMADKNNLGISGHSHGGWLGPMVAAENPIFKAASFAEGFGNYLSLYGHLDGARNKELHEYYLEFAPYDNPDRYLELSPIFEDSLTTKIPTLLEFGQHSPVAKQGVEFAKAFWRQDTPHKLTIYPGEGHSIRSPALQANAMKRNIDWFEKWMD
ncbi:alpha/beta hydrolase family protein [Fodinibius sp. Rm-B-1B1-1]|uniref:alpha/beta hydrolase family protein n=1 Tax=Fodinibius alkaliphilus TaxID=3140241 RepID=UPI00315A469C